MQTKEDNLHTRRFIKIHYLQGGMYYVYLWDNFSSTSWAMLFGIACECIAIAWLFGVDKYYEEFCIMLQYKPRFPWFKYCWKFVTPPVTLV